MRARKVFFVGVDNAESEAIAPKIHAALAALAKHDPDGKWPRGEPFHHGDVTLSWQEVEQHAPASKSFGGLFGMLRRFSWP